MSSAVTWAGSQRCNRLVSKMSGKLPGPIFSRPHAEPRTLLAPEPLPGWICACDEVVHPPPFPPPKHLVQAKRFWNGDKSVAGGPSISPRLRMSACCLSRTYIEPLLYHKVGLKRITCMEDVIGPLKLSPLEFRASAEGPGKDCGLRILPPGST